MRSAMTFSAFVDVYNLEKTKIFGRDLYIKRFEEAWFSWKIKCWLFKLDYYTPTTIEQIASFGTKDIEKVIEIYYSNFQSRFISDWQNFHNNNCFSKNQSICKSMCRIFKKENYILI